MFIAMNRFKVVPGSQTDFEEVWTTRDTHLRDVPGFITFHLLRGPDREDHTLYSSHSIWRCRADFEAWTRSEASPTIRPAPTSRSISATPNSRASRSSKPSRPRHRCDDLKKGRGTAADLG